MEDSVTLAFMFLIGWVLGIVTFAIWAHKARPLRVYEKYPPHVTKQLAIPFANSWKHRVDPADVGTIQEWRRRYFARYLTLVGLPALVFLGYVAFWGLQLSGRAQVLVERSQATLEMLKSQRGQGPGDVPEKMKRTGD